jgi:capsular exopolysaccharide synthesis family protein
MGIKVGNNSRLLTDQEARRNLVVQILLSNLKVKLSTDTRIAQISFSSPDARLAQRVADSYADNFIRLNLARRFDASGYSLNFLRNQIREAQERLSRSERDAIGYARRAQLIDTSNASGNDAGPQSLTTASLIGLNQSLSEAVAKRVAAEARWKASQNAPILTLPEVASNGTVQQLVQQRAQVQAQYQQELQTRRENYPTVRQFSARSAELSRQIRTIASNVRATLQQDFITAQAQETGLRNTIDKLKATTLDEQSRSIQLSILRREATTNRQQLDALLRRYNEVNAQSGIQLNNLSVVDRAETPGAPYWPSVPLNIALALLLSLLLSAIYVLGRENLFEMIRTPDDVTARLRLALLGAVPVSEDVLGALDDPKSMVAEAFSSIRTSLSLSSPEGMPRAIAVTSTQAGEGKSTACYGLALSLARLGRSVVLVDSDLRRPQVHRLFGSQNQLGLSNVLSGSTGLDDCLARNVATRVDAIFTGPIPPDPTELLGSERMKALVRELASRYDHVIVDSAPVLGLADAPLVATSVEGIVFVVQSARSSVRAVQNALARMRQGRTPIIGAVLSRFDPGKSGYGYEYQYAYSYAYGSSRT